MFGLFDKNKQLIKAISNSDVDWVNTLIAKGADVNKYDHNGNPVILNSIFSKSTKIVTALIKAGCDIEAKDMFGRTPLFASVQSSLMEVTRILINANADIEAKDNGGNTALTQAVSYYGNSRDKSKYQIILMLLKAGADVHAKNTNGKSPLELAYEQANISLIKVLSGNSQDEFNFRDIEVIFLPCLKIMEKEANSLLERSKPSGGSIDGISASFTRSYVGEQREHNVSKPFNAILVQAKKLLPNDKTIQRLSEIEIKGLEAGRVIRPGAEKNDCRIALKNVTALLTALESHTK